MTARELLANATPRPWRVEVGFYVELEGATANVCDVGIASHPGGRENAALIVAAVNEYEAHDAIANFLRAAAAPCALDPDNGAVMVCVSRDQAKALLARLDAIRSST